MKQHDAVLKLKQDVSWSKTYQVPIEVRADRRYRHSHSSMVNYVFTSERREDTEERLANEIFDAANNTGGAVKEKRRYAQMAEANKALAHHRF